MHIFLVNPVCLDHRITDDDAQAVPMGLYYLGALLKDKEIDVTLVNLAAVQAPLPHLEQLLEQHLPDIVGFSLLNASRHCAMDGAALAKALNPDVTVVFGGPGATFLATHLFSVCPALDYIVKGEGENSFSQLVNHMISNTPGLPHDIKGLVFRHDQTLMDTGEPTLLGDLDSLVHPATYFDYQHISLSRGCPGRCRFCGSPQFWGKSHVRFHSATWFVDEMALLIQRGITHFFISDDTFTMDKARVLAVCGEIIQRNLACTWVAISRVDFLDEEILFNMRRAGCIQISFGVESGSETIRKALGKPFKTQRIVKAFEMTRAFGILPRAYIIYGSPGETPGTIQETVDLIEQIKPLSLISYILVLFPGTQLYNDLLSRKKISADVWNQKIEDIPWFQLDPNLNLEQVTNFGKEIRNTFFSRIQQYALDTELVDNRELYPFHADFLSRLAMTFSHGDYSNHPQVKNPLKTAALLYERALSYAPDARAYLGFGMLHQKQRHFDRAVALMEKALIHFGNDKSLNICMAVSLMNLGRFSDALTFLEKFQTHGDIQPYIDACKSKL
ncbi:MAG: radical SAM protein [Desulfobacterium sp.]